MPAPKPSRSSSTEPSSKSASITPSHLVDALALLGDQLAQQRLIGDRAGLRGPAGEVGQVALGERDRLGVVGGAQVDDAVGVLDVDRPDLAGVEHAEAAALDHRGAAHADARVLGRDHDVAAAEQRGVAGEAVAGGDADERHEAAELGEQRERAAVEAGDDRHVDVAGPPAAALGEQHDRQPAALGDLEQPVLLGVVAHALRAGEDRVVVGHRHARLAVDLADAADEAVGGRARDQLLARAPALLRGEQQRPVLDEAALVDEVGEVLARGAPAALVAARDGVGRAASSPISWRSRTARRSARSPPAAQRRRCSSSDRRARPAPSAPGSSASSSWPSSTASPTATASSRTTPPRLGEHLVLHLHRLEHDERGARSDWLAAAARSATTTAGERRCDANCSVRGHRADRSLHRRSALRRASRPRELASRRCPRRAADGAAERREALKELLARGALAARAARSSPRRARRSCSAPATPTPS